MKQEEEMKLRAENARLRHLLDMDSAVPIKDAAERIGRKPATIKRMIQRGDITPVELPGVSGILIPNREIARLLGGGFQVV